MCNEQVLKPPEEINKNREQEINELRLEQADPQLEQPNILLNQSNKPLEQFPDNNPNLLMGEQQSLRVHEHLNNVNAHAEGTLLMNVVQVPGEVDLEEKQINKKASARSDKSRKNHMKRSNKLQADATRINARYNETNESLNDYSEMPLDRLKTIEENCIKSGIEGIRLIAESKLESIKSKGEKDTEEIHYLASCELEKSVSLYQFYDQMYVRNEKRRFKEREKTDWKAKQNRLYTQKKEEYDKIIKKQHQAMENSGILYKLPNTMEKMKGKMASDKQGSGQLAKESPISINTLSFRDFSKMIGTYSRGQVAFSGKGLTAINNGKFSAQSDELSEDNLLIRQRFLTVVMDQMGGMDKMRENGTEEFFALTRNQLGLNDESLLQAKPLSRRLIQDIVTKTHDKVSVVGKIIQEDKNNPSMLLEKRIANNINELLGGRTEKELTQEVNSALSVLRGYITETPNLNKRQMDNILKGNIQRLRDEVFASVNTVCNQIQMLGKTGDNNPNTRAFMVDSFLEDKEAMNLLAAFSIQKMAAGTEAGAALENLKLQSYIEEISFSYAKPKPGLQEDVNKVNIEALALQGSAGIEQILGEGKDEAEKAEIVQFSRMCDYIKVLNDCRAKAFETALTKDEKKDMRVAAGNIVGYFEHVYDIEALDKINTKLGKTRFGEGYEQVRALFVDRKFSLDQFLNTFAPDDDLEKVDNAEEQEKAKVKKINPIDSLSGHAKSVASVLTGTGHASEFITKKNNDPFAQNMRTLRNFLDEFKSGKVLAKTINFDGQDITFVQDSQKVLKIVVDDVGISLAHGAAKVVERLESEILLNDKAFPQETIKTILGNMENSPDNSAEMVQSRSACVAVLQTKTGKPGTFFNNISSKSLLEYVKELTIIDDGHKVSNKESERKLRAVVEHIISNVNSVGNAIYVNGREASELIGQLEKETWKKDSKVVAKVTGEIEQPKDGANQEQWTSDEKKIVDFVADLIFSNDNWVADEVETKPGDRIKTVLQNNVSTLRIMIQNPGIITSILDRMPLGNENDASDIKKQVTEQIDGILNNPYFKMLQNGEEKKDEKKKGDEGGFFDALKQGTIALKTKLKNSVIEVGIKSALNEPENAGLFASIENQITELITEQSAQIQNMVSTSLKSMDEKDEEENEKEVDNQENIEEDKSVEGLNRIIQDSIKGKSGQGKFLKNVFQSYFGAGNIMDKHAMFAAALRYSSPKRKLPETATEEEKEAEQERASSSFIGGFLKGTGPLMQKTLQGIPAGAMPSFIDKALKDMKSNLAPIPPKYVEAQLNAMVNRSKGEITRIHMKKSLGAASVGQAFLCTIYGPNLNKNGEGKGEDVVVKLLRPDVRNRIEREKEVMIKAAEDTDVSGGMKATYLGQLKRIDEEMDLTIEARNAQTGEIYENALGTVKSMKVNPLIEPTMNSLVLEKAPGTTVDRYMNDVRTTQEKVMSDLNKDDDELKDLLSIKGSQEESEKFALKMSECKATLVTEVEKMRQRQKHLIDMAEAWVTEGVYGDGFYHGDLHAGNMMIDDKGVTLIDYGNATQLDVEQKSNILRMMSAAAGGEEFTSMFQDAFHKLLGGASEEAYKDKKNELRTEFNNILKLGASKDAGLRICAALMKSQNLGVEVPSAIYNFSQSQMRLQSTIQEMNDTIEGLKANILKIQDMERGEDKWKISKAGFMPKIAGVNVHESNPFNLRPVNDDAPNLLKEQFSEQLKEKDESSLQQTLRSVSYKDMGNVEKNALFHHLESAKNSLLNDQANGKKMESSLLEEMQPILQNLSSQFVAGAGRNKVGMEAMCAFDGCKTEDYHAKLDKLTEKIADIAKNAWPNFDETDVRAKIEAAWSEFAEKAEKDEERLHELVSEYRSEQAKNNADSNNLNQLGDELYKQYDKMNSTIKMNTGNFLKFRNACRDESSKQQLDADMKLWLSAEDYAGRREPTIEKSYPALVKAYQSDSPNIVELEKAFFNSIQGVMDRMTVKRIEARESEKWDHRGPRLEDFVDVMGEVISNNLMASLRRLGVLEGYKLRKALS